MSLSVESASSAVGGSEGWGRVLFLAERFRSGVLGSGFLFQTIMAERRHPLLGRIVPLDP